MMVSRFLLPPPRRGSNSTPAGSFLFVLPSPSLSSARRKRISLLTSCSMSGSSEAAAAEAEKARSEARAEAAAAVVQVFKVEETKTPPAAGSRAGAPPRRGPASRGPCLVSFEGKGQEEKRMEDGTSEKSLLTLFPSTSNDEK